MIDPHYITKWKPTSWYAFIVNEGVLNKVRFFFFGYLYVMFFGFRKLVGSHKGVLYQKKKKTINNSNVLNTYW